MLQSYASVICFFTSHCALNVIENSCNFASLEKAFSYFFYTFFVRFHFTDYSMAELTIRPRKRTLDKDSHSRPRSSSNKFNSLVNPPKLKSRISSSKNGNISTIGSLNVEELNAALVLMNWVLRQVVRKQMGGLLKGHPVRFFKSRAPLQRSCKANRGLLLQAILH